VTHIPLIQSQAVPFPSPSPASFQWLFFTSKNGVKAFYASALNEEPRWAALPVATVGPATAQAVREFGITPQYISPRFDAESAAEDFARQHGQEFLQILWPCGNLSDPALKNILVKAGLHVTPIIAYETLTPVLSDNERRRLLETFDLLVFTSPSSVMAYRAIQPAAPNTRIACIGPKTAQAAKETLGHCDIQASPYTLDGLADSILQFFTVQRR
jgi:uroporphyrinogen III methyltransferase/synthase